MNGLQPFESTVEQTTETIPPRAITITAATMTTNKITSLQGPLTLSLTAARLAQLGERRSAEREVVSSNPDRTNTEGLKITEEKVLSLQ